MAENALAHPQFFEERVDMWVFQEMIELPESRKENTPFAGQDRHQITDVINYHHENIKYLPGTKLPSNIVANPSLEETVKGASILVFNFPHQFVDRTCSTLQGKVLPYARGISCIKGVDSSNGQVHLFSETIGKRLGIYVGALSGANLANEIAKELYSESTIAYDPPPFDSRPASPLQDPSGLNSPSPLSEGIGASKSQLHKDSSGLPKVPLSPLPLDYPPVDQNLIKTLFHRPYFHISVVRDVAGVSLGGALKNIVALAAGFVEGKGWGDNAKAAVMRIGLLEMVRFGKTFFSASVVSRTFLEESAGVADLITSCNGGRNFRCAMLSVQRGVSVEEVQNQELNGQMLQGTSTAEEVYEILQRVHLQSEFPLFTVVYREFIPFLITPVPPIIYDTNRLYSHLAWQS